MIDCDFARTYPSEIAQSIIFNTYEKTPRFSQGVGWGIGGYYTTGSGLRQAGEK
jgi:hypothetical protein